MAKRLKMLSLNRSFVYGICFASITWIVSLYLYFQLTKSSVQLAASEANVLDYSENVYRYKETEWQPPKSNGAFKNSENLIKYLRGHLKSKTGIRKNGTNIYEQDLNDLGMIRNKNDQKIRDEGYKIHAYNVLISSKLNLNRTIPDTRNNLCKNIKYSNLPTASIIICFYNEHYETLLRSVYSVINRTPTKILKEIILIDDYSDHENLHKNLKKYVGTNFEKVKLFKTEKREGLIRARMFGAKKATGDVLIFLDSHIEVNTDWAEPLLQRIKDNYTNVAVPVIDIINADTFNYSASPLVRGGFNWGLHFKWENLPQGTLAVKEDFIKPIKSPTMAGGLFAMSRKYFVDLGEYDPGMNVWGGENLEMSFRIWMCGGNLEIIPCSRVGHVFRQRRPYGAPDGQDTMLYNSLRVAHVWMDDYKEYFLQQRKDATKITFGNIDSRIQLRKELKCNNFTWYLKNVYPELGLPTDNEDRLKKKWATLEKDMFQPWQTRKRTYIAQYKLRLSNSSFCAQSSKDVKTKGSSLVLRKCSKSKSQIWYETDKSEIVLSQLLCLQASSKAPILYKCHEQGSDQEWKHKGTNNTPIYNLALGTCLGAKNMESGSAIVMKMCTEPDLISWDFVGI